MTLSRVIELLGVERECVSRDCDRDCGRCDLAQDRSELLEMYDEAVRTVAEYDGMFGTALDDLEAANGDG